MILQIPVSSCRKSWVLRAIRAEKVGGKRNGLVEGIGVQALGVTKGCCHGLDTGTGDIVEGILLREAPATRL
jgi:hypothetical protein